MTTDSKVLNSMLNELQIADNTFKASIDKFISVSLKIANKAKEFQEELALYGDVMFHIYLRDIDFNIWIRSSEGTLKYNTSIYEADSQKTRTIHFILLKNTLKRILAKSLDAIEAYMKGLIEIDGEMSDAIIAKNLLKVYSDYLKNS